MAVGELMFDGIYSQWTLGQVNEYLKTRARAFRIVSKEQRHSSSREIIVMHGVIVDIGDTTKQQRMHLTLVNDRVMSLQYFPEEFEGFVKDLDNRMKIAIPVCRDPGDLQLCRMSAHVGNIRISARVMTSHGPMVEWRDERSWKDYAEALKYD